MKQNQRLILTLIFLLLSAPAVFGQGEVKPEDAVSDKGEIFLVCNRAKDIRWLRAFRLENGRCKTYYSKEGYVQVVSSASYFSSCEAVLNTVKKNIEEGGFKCKEQQLASMVEFE